MNFYRPLALTLLLSVLVSTSCSKDAPPASSSAGSLTANASLNLAARPFAKHQLNTPGFHYMNDFIRADVRARMDEEPVGDADGSYDPATVEPVSPPSDEPAPEPEARNEEPEQQYGSTDENPAGISLEAAKFLWAKKSFGDAVKAAPTSHGVIVLYADENYFDTERLMAYIQEGRDRIAEASGAPGDRIQVVYGGYRSMPQVELWVIREGEAMPEFKPDDRSKMSQPEN